MDGVTAALLLGVGFLVIVLVLALNRRGSMSTRVEFGLFKGTIVLGSDERQVVERQLRKAEERRGVGADAAGQVPPTATEYAQLHILWCDDNPDFNIYEVLMLRDMGHNIVQTLRTETAMAYLSSGAFDLVITDLTRGENESAGFALLRELSGNWPAVVYAGDIASREQRALELGARAVVNMPRDLLAAVQAVAESRTHAGGDDSSRATDVGT
jgi:CheY-like chemotaxis protein